MSVTFPWRSIQLRVRNPELDVPADYIRAKRIVLAALGLIFFALVGFIPGFLAEDAGFRAFMLLMGIGASVLLLGALGIACIPSRGNTDLLIDNSLKFETSRLPDILLIVTYAIGGLAGVVGLMSSMQPGSYLSDSTTGRFAPWILIPVAFFAIFDQVKRSLKPRGITLTEEGIQWQDLKRGGSLTWDDLESVELGAFKGMKRLYLREDGDIRDLHIIEPSGLGSDPVVIAEVIDYFRRNPKERHKLNDPRAALALVTEPI